MSAEERQRQLDEEMKITKQREDAAFDAVRAKKAEQALQKHLDEDERRERRVLRNQLLSLSAALILTAIYVFNHDRDIFGLASIAWGAFFGLTSPTGK